jgi:hypothetical protein
MTGVELNRQQIRVPVNTQARTHVMTAVDLLVHKMLPIPRHGNNSSLPRQAE